VFLKTCGFNSYKTDKKLGIRLNAFEEIDNKTMRNIVKEKMK
jgi:hypothetical protein